MTARRSPAGGRGGSRFARLLGSRILPALALVGIGLVIVRDRREEARLEQAREAERAVRVAERQAAFAAGDFALVFALCSDGWRDAFSVSYQPQALAWTRRGLDGYFLEGIDTGSWRQLRCTADGFDRGPRVAAPLRETLPAESPVGSATDEEDRWRLALAQLGAAPLGGEELAVELLLDPLTGAVLIRRWRGLEGGARPTLEPADAPNLELLIAAPEFPLAAGAAPPKLRTLPRHRWAREADAAFAVIEKALPAGAGVVEIHLTDDAIELSVESPTPAFEGNPPARYGDLDFDEYGIAESSWWYPRTDPGFGCPTGQALATVRAEFSVARDRIAPGAVLQAWYSCSPAYSDGRRGVWNLVWEGS
jgi:hypothetical protein